jgi:hypothetical protein
MGSVLRVRPTLSVLFIQPQSYKQSIARAPPISYRLFVPLVVQSLGYVRYGSFMSCKEKVIVKATPKFIISYIILRAFMKANRFEASLSVLARTMWWTNIESSITALKNILIGFLRL